MTQSKQRATHTFRKLKCTRGKLQLLPASSKSPAQSRGLPAGRGGGGGGGARLVPIHLRNFQAGTPKDEPWPPMMPTSRVFPPSTNVARCPSGVAGNSTPKVRTSAPSAAAPAAVPAPAPVPPAAADEPEEVEDERSPSNSETTSSMSRPSRESGGTTSRTCRTPEGEKWTKISSQDPESKTSNNTSLCERIGARLAAPKAIRRLLPTACTGAGVPPTGLMAELASRPSVPPLPLPSAPLVVSGGGGGSAPAAAEGSARPPRRRSIDASTSVGYGAAPGVAP
mmetsp:Transcript_144302/g.461257  ORF Transcript_144302/g.461257 Transcript_144302/m.461257 type:complete len:282 (-) Transcript_144302:47-892(-)